MEIIKEIVTYQQVIEGYTLDGDNFDIGAYTLKPPIKKVFLENPNLKDTSKCMIFFDRIDGLICGRQMFFPTKVKVGEKIVEAQSGSSLQTVEEYRQYAVGMDMINYPIKTKEYPIIIYGGISTMIKPIYKALRFHLFEIPSYWQPRNSQFLLQYIGIKGLLLKILTACCNLILKPIIGIINSRIKYKYKRYNVNKLDVVPQWVDDIIFKDSHKYAEVHDRNWMQWTLDNNFFSKEYESQSFYEITEKGQKLGFFMINERNSNQAEHNIDSVIFGSVYEWGSFNEKILPEEVIHQIAFTKFSKHVDIAISASNNNSFSKVMRNMFAFKHGNASVVVKDLSKAYKDIGDIDNWRLRMGYCDTPFY